MLTETSVRTTKLPSGEAVPVLGQGTWHLAEGRHRDEEEVQALRLGLDLGMTLIDTAEMYAEGGAEELVGEAIEGRRKDVFLVSKVLPHNATVRGTMLACDRSLRRLRTGTGEATDRVLYNLARRGPEYDLLPWCRQRHIPIMAYSPIEQGRILKHSTLEAVAIRHSATPAQVALAWVLQQDGVIAIPKAGSARHVRENRGALEARLTKQDMAELDRAFPLPTEPRPLEML